MLFLILWNFVAISVIIICNAFHQDSKFFDVEHLSSRNADAPKERAKTLKRIFEKKFSHYEMLNEFLFRQKRQNENQEKVDLQFEAFGTTFRLLMRPLFEDHDSRVVPEQIQVTTLTKSSNKTFYYKPLYYYNGFVVGHDNSSAHGQYRNGKFDGVVHMIGHSFFIESVSRYIGVPDHRMVIYKAEDVKVSDDTIVIGNNTFVCQIKQRSGDFKLLGRKRKHNLPSHGSVPRLGMPKMKLCEIHVVADHTFFENVGNKDITQTVNEIVFYLKETDGIFRTTDFDGNGVSDNIGFSILKLTIFQEDLSQGYIISGKIKRSEEYLELFSQYNFNHACLGIAFTHRDFNDGVVGLAWMASASPNVVAGGICQETVYFNEKLFNFNTVLISTLNYKNTVTRLSTALTTAHEIGHSFGSPHDENNQPICSPNGTLGNYLMHPMSTDGSMPNNRIFSSCSRKAMEPIIKLRGTCFKDFEHSVCGNRVVEGDEECDCGDVTICNMTDHCCVALGATGTSALPCHFDTNAGKYCSPISSLCCNKDCKVVDLGKKKVCSAPSECSEESLCDGKSAECPPQQPLKNGKLCNKGTGLCFNGLCSKSSCELLGDFMSNCQCISNVSNMCLFCCQYQGKAETCKSFQEWDPHGLNGEMVVYRLPGYPCNDYTGYCDDEHVCVEVDTTSDMRNVVKFKKRTKTNDTILWLKDNWFYIFLVFVVVVLGVMSKIVHKKFTNSTKRNSVKAFVEKAENCVCLNTEQLKHLHELVNNDVTSLTDLEDEHCDIDYVQLEYLFPTASKVVIRKLTKNSPNQMHATKLIASEGFPMRQFKRNASSQTDIGRL